MIFVSISVVLRLSFLCWSLHVVLAKGGISCKNYAGRDVDWFVVYKLPKTKPNSFHYWTPIGDEMAYYGSDSPKGMWQILYSSIFYKKLNPIWETLRPAYRKTSKVAYACYNDQPPKKYGGTRGGHSKGVLMASNDGDGGTVWLQHSVPQFVDFETDYLYPSSGRENGQLFLCLSLPLGAAETIASHLQVQLAHVFKSRPEKWAKTRLPEFWKVLNKMYVRDQKILKIDLMLTKAKKRVVAIAKSPKWSRDIYTEDMVSAMKDSIFVQSWKNGNGGAQQSFCGSLYTVTDISSLTIRGQGREAHFSSSEDHSKWYVTKTKSMFCFSTLNRMCSQRSRGGEITCLEDIYLARLFRNSIAETSKCNAMKVPSMLQNSKLKTTCT